MSRLAFSKFYYRMLSLRYKVTLSGMDTLTRQKGPFLILPNHQALVDPQILVACLDIHGVEVSPLVTEAYFNIPLVGGTLRRYHCVAVPDLEKGRHGVELVAEMPRLVVESLQKGTNVLIYPSGQLARQEREIIRHKQVAWRVVQALPEDTKVIAVRIRGLWGSRWSVARTHGRTPNFMKVFLVSILYALVHLFVLMPKRKVTYDFCDVTSEAKVKAEESRDAFNGFLEAYYNAGLPEK